MKDALWWYADPQNWDPSKSNGVPGPYSATGVPSAHADRGRQARAALNADRTLSGLIRILVFMSSRNPVEVAHEAGIHPGRLEDIMHDKSHTTRDERRGLARTLKVDVSELDSLVNERTH